MVKIKWGINVGDSKSKYKDFNDIGRKRFRADPQDFPAYPSQREDIGGRYARQYLLPIGERAGLPIATDHEKVCDSIGISVGELFPREITDRFVGLHY